METNASENMIVIVEPELTSQKIRRFANLREGWHYGEGERIATQTIEQALSLEAFAQENGLRETDAFPGTAGEVRITIYEGAEYLEFTIEPDRSITFVHERDGKEINSIESMSIEDAKRRIIEHRDRKCDLSESSIQIILISASRDPKALDSVHPLMVAYPWLNTNASREEGKYSVSTSESFTQSILNNDLHFGNLTPRFSPVPIS